MRRPAGGRYWSLAVVAALAAVALTGCGAGVTAAAAPASTTAPQAPVTANSAAPAIASHSSGLTCADVGGVFAVHGIDGRGVCVPTDPRPQCHQAPQDRDDRHLAVLTMTPPDAQGTIDHPSLIAKASNADCWKQPAGH
jgi:hypothetical protein